MTRRGFFALAAVAAAVDPERLLWIPGRKLISIPAPRRVPAPGDVFTMSGRLATPWDLKLGDIVTVEGLPFEYVVTEVGKSSGLFSAALKFSPGQLRQLENHAIQPCGPRS